MLQKKGIVHWKLLHLVFELYQTQSLERAARPILPAKIIADCATLINRKKETTASRWFPPPLRTQCLYYTLLSAWYENRPQTSPHILFLESSPADLSKPILFLFGGLLYFFLFHRLARFPGPLLSKGSDITTKIPIITIEIPDETRRNIGTTLFLAAGDHEWTMPGTRNMVILSYMILFEPCWYL